MQELGGVPALTSAPQARAAITVCGGVITRRALRAIHVGLPAGHAAARACLTRRAAARRHEDDGQAVWSRWFAAGASVTMSAARCSPCVGAFRAQIANAADKRRMAACG